MYVITVPAAEKLCGLPVLWMLTAAATIAGTNAVDELVTGEPLGGVPLAVPVLATPPA